jgi:hypothetical protein
LPIFADAVWIEVDILHQSVDINRSFSGYDPWMVEFVCMHQLIKGIMNRHLRKEMDQVRIVVVVVMVVVVVLVVVMLVVAMVVVVVVVVVVVEISVLVGQHAATTLVVECAAFITCNMILCLPGHGRGE